MPGLARYSRSFLAGVAPGLVVFLGVATGAPAAEPRHEGVATCASTTCHGAARPLAGTPVLQNEYVTWSTFDPHSGAYRTLRSPRSAAIARRLGRSPADQAPACLSCHAEAVPANRRGPKFQQDDGIGCEACHGAAQNWLATHDDGTPGNHANSLRAGLRALDEPGTRATVCIGCHIGNRDRVATHAMMAAGHPRLSFELDTFTELWRTTGGREHYRRDAGYVARKPEVSGPDVWLTGLVGASLAAVAQVQAAVVQAALPEFAAFNCYSCHRNMGNPDQQGVAASDLASAPGTLRVNDGSLRLLATALQAREPARAARLSRGLDELQRAANHDRAAVAPAAGAIRRQLVEVETILRQRPTRPAEQQAILAAVLGAAGSGAYPDYATAEQAAMAVVVLLADGTAATRHKPDIDALFAALDDDAAFDRVRFARILGRLGTAAPRN